MLQTLTGKTRVIYQIETSAVLSKSILKIDNNFSQYQEKLD